MNSPQLTIVFVFDHHWVGEQVASSFNAQSTFSRCKLAFGLTASVNKEATQTTQHPQKSQPINSEQVKKNWP